MTSAGWLLASFDGLQAARQRLNAAGSTRDVAVLLMAGLAIAAFWAGLYFWDRRRRPAQAAGYSLGLFADLCRVHGLSREEKELLQTTTNDLAIPSLVFVDPRVLDRLRASHPAHASAYGVLYERLFDAQIGEDSTTSR